MNGKILRLTDRGFGFIKGDDGVEYFFHRSATKGIFDTMREGQAVTFDEGHGDKGPRADNVKLG